MEKIKEYYKLEYFDLLPLIFDVEEESMGSLVWIMDHKGNKGVLAAYDCSLGFSAWMPDIKNNSIGKELSADEIIPLFRSLKDMTKEEVKELEALNRRCLEAEIFILGVEENIDGEFKEPPDKIIHSENCVTIPDGLPPHTERSFWYLRKGFDAYGWSKFKREDGKPLAIIEDN